MMIFFVHVTPVYDFRKRVKGVPTVLQAGATLNINMGQVHQFGAGGTLLQTLTTCGMGSSRYCMIIIATFLLGILLLYLLIEHFVGSPIRPDESTTVE